MKKTTIILVCLVFSVTTLSLFLVSLSENSEREEISNMREILYNRYILSNEAVELPSNNFYYINYEMGEESVLNLLQEVRSLDFFFADDINLAYNKVPKTLYSYRLDEQIDPAITFQESLEVGPSANSQDSISDFLEYKYESDRFYYEFDAEEEQINNASALEVIRINYIFKDIPVINIGGSFTGLYDEKNQLTTALLLYNNKQLFGGEEIYVELTKPSLENTVAQIQEKENIIMLPSGITNEVLSPNTNLNDLGFSTQAKVEIEDLDYNYLYMSELNVLIPVFVFEGNIVEGDSSAPIEIWASVL